MVRRLELHQGVLDQGLDGVAVPAGEGERDVEGNAALDDRQSRQRLPGRTAGELHAAVE